MAYSLPNLLLKVKEVILEPLKEMGKKRVKMKLPL
jgi:hypothetical protein